MLMVSVDGVGCHVVRWWVAFGGDRREAQDTAPGHQEVVLGWTSKKQEDKRHKEHKHKEGTGFNARFRNPCMGTLKLKLRTYPSILPFLTGFCRYLKFLLFFTSDCATFYGRQRHPSPLWYCGETA